MASGLNDILNATYMIISFFICRSYKVNEKKYFIFFPQTYQKRFWTIQGNIPKEASRFLKEVSILFGNAFRRQRYHRAREKITHASCKYLVGRGLINRHKPRNRRSVYGGSRGPSLLP